MRVRLAHHEIVIVRFAPGPDEVRRAEQGSGGRAYLGDFGNVFRQRGRVDQGRLIEPGQVVRNCSRIMDWGPADLASRADIVPDYLDGV